MLNNKKIGKRIALLRKENGYTQEQLAGILHVTGQAVSKWEIGNALPETSLLPVLAGVLKTSIDRLPAPDWQKNEFFYKSGDLARYYSDWQIIYCEEQIVDCSSGNSPHQHAVNSIIAKKVKNV